MLGAASHLRSAFRGALLLLAIVPGAARAQAAFFGPLTFEEQAPLQRLSYTHAIEGADLVQRGALRADVSLGYANIFQRDSAASHVLVLDLERLITTLAVRYGVGERLEIGGRLSWETSGGGVLDGFISGWHQRLGLANADRHLHPEGAYEQQLRIPRGPVLLDVPQRTAALADLRLFAKWRAWARPDGRGVLSLRAVAHRPAQEGLVGVRRTDLALMAMGRASWERWHLHGTLGAATVRAARDYDGLLRSSSWFADLSLERNLAPWISALVQYTLATPRLRGFEDSDLDGWPRNLVFGAAGALGSAWRWNVSFQEDVPPSTPSVDFTLGLGLARSF